MLIFVSGDFVVLFTSTMLIISDDMIIIVRTLSPTRFHQFPIFGCTSHMHAAVCHTQNFGVRGSPMEFHKSGMPILSWDDYTLILNRRLIFICISLGLYYIHCRKCK